METSTNMKPYKSALYMRLSREDGDGESASISTQRKLLRNFAKENNYLVYDEYIDDGVSGTTFERPNFLRMKKDIEDEKINMVITKDLSRLGRDYINTGNLLEIYFPSKKVRYIAINDGYDSDSMCTDIAPFRNVVNEMYARDISKKIKSSFEVKMQAGEYIGAFAPYGYKKDPCNKNQLIVDPEVAEVVREMFALAESGTGPGEIAKLFWGRDIPTPAEYRCSQNPHLNIGNYSKRREWTATMVCKMLRNITYTGVTAQGKTSKISFKSKLSITKPQSEWYVVENTHEALISTAQFEAVRKRVIARRNKPKSDFSNVFSGVVKCMDCGRNMSTAKTKNKEAIANLVCGGYKLYGRKECTNHFMDYSFLCDMVSREIGQQINLTRAEKDSIICALNQEKNSLRRVEKETARKKEMEQLQTRQGELDQIMAKLYEDKVFGKIAPQSIDRMLELYSKEERGICGRLEILVEEENNREKVLNEDFSQLVENIIQMKSLNKELLHLFIEKIEISQGYYDENKKKHQTVRIHYKFRPEAETANTEGQL